MKRRIAVWVIAAFGLVSVLTTALSVWFLSEGRGIGGEFDARYNEVESVLAGTDPFLIWTGEMASSRYYPYDKPELKCEGRSWIHAYTPWSYTCLMPLVASFPKPAAWKVYRSLLLVFLCCMIVMFYRHGKRLTNATGDGVLCAAVAMAMGATASCSVQIGNYGLVIALAVLAMAFALQRGRDVLAGVCWAVALIKPQDAALLFVPLVIHRKWKTVLTAGLVCLVATLPPAWFCHTSPLSLILEVARLRPVSTGAAASSLLNPFIVCFPRMQGYVTAASLANALIVGVLCCLMSWWLRTQRRWLIKFAPVIVCSSVMWYMTYLDRCLYFIVLAALFELHAVIREERQRNLAVASMVLILLMSLSIVAFCANVANSLVTALGWQFSERMLQQGVLWYDCVLTFAVLCACFFWCLGARGKDDADVL